MSKKKELKSLNSATINLQNRRVRDIDNKKCLISLEKAMISNSNYGLCLNSAHSHSKEQNSKKYNTALIDLFHTLCKMTWNDIDRISKHNKGGYERLSVDIIKSETIQNHFKNLGRDKFIIFRFGSDFRACGFRQMDIFYLVCIDYDYSLYNHGS